MWREIRSVMESGSDSGHVFMALLLEVWKKCVCGGGGIKPQAFSIVLLEARSKCPHTRPLV